MSVPCHGGDTTFPLQGYKQESSAPEGDAVPIFQFCLFYKASLKR